MPHTLSKRLSFVVAALAVSVPAGRALAWAETGHRLIGSLATEALPAEIPAFLRTRETVWRMGELSREPDRSKGTGQPHDADLDPAHFVDADDKGGVLNGPSLSELPANRETYEKALGAVRTDSWKAGWLPYSIEEGWQQLVKDFAYWRVDRVGERKGPQRAWFAKDRQLRELLILRDMGYWSHFVGDGSQPLHVTVHFNGWGDYPNPNNYTQEKIHAPFEGAFVRANVSAAAVRAAMPAYQPCGCTIQQATGRYLLATYAYVEPLYRLWNEGGFKGGDPRGVAFATQRVAAGAAMLRDLIIEAWRASAEASVGYPAVSVKAVEAGQPIPYEEIHGTE